MLHGDVLIIVIYISHHTDYKMQQNHGSKSFFADVIASIYDIKFANDEWHLLSHDYMNLKVFRYKPFMTLYLKFKSDSSNYLSGQKNIVCMCILAFSLMIVD